MGVSDFLAKIPEVSGVKTVSLIGSLTTQKPIPKDADLLVRLQADADVAALAMLGRKLKGHAQQVNAGADIFMCAEGGHYMGRTCSYRECRPRVMCRGNQCGSGTRICNDIHVVNLCPSLVEDPPIDLWPAIIERIEVPPDVRSILLS